MTCPTNDRGLTLMELMVVALLLALTASIAWPQWRRWVRGTLARAECDEVRSRLKEARMKALLDRCEVTLDLSDLRYHTASVPVVRFQRDGSTEPLAVSPKVSSLADELWMDASGRVVVSTLREKI